MLYGAIIGAAIGLVYALIKQQRDKAKAEKEATAEPEKDEVV